MMRESKDYVLSDLISLAAVQKMADSHYRATGMPLGIVDAFDDSVLVGSGWQDICLKFHRANPRAHKRCQESDSYIKGHLKPGEACTYKCKNGLWDIGVPIMVAGRHLATLFLGQFFYEDEAPDREFFISQADEFGFDEADYLAALDRVPVFSKGKVAYTLDYNMALATFITDLAEQELARIKAEKLLQEKKQELSAIFDQSQRMLWLISLDGLIREANPTAMNAAWLNGAEVAGRPFWDGSLWGDSPGIIEKTRSAIQKAADGEASRFELVLPDTADNDFHLDLSIEPIVDRAGKVHLIVAGGDDITECWQMGEQLRFTQYAVDKTIDQAFWMTEDSSFYYVNDAACRSLGYSPEEFYELKLPDIDPEVSQERFSELWQIVKDTGGIRIESTHRAKGGRVYPVEIRSNYVSFGGKEYICAFATDISERKQRWPPNFGQLC